MEEDDMEDSHVNGGHAGPSNMNMDGAFDTYWKPATVSNEEVESIHNAINATLDPQISNDVRQEALEYLEQLKTQFNAPHYGFTLAEEWDFSHAVRYYGLQLLEYAIRYRWAEYNHDQREQLKHWVKCLAGSLLVGDPTYVRNKIAQLWVELAKRCWGEEWMDMDRLLVNLWEQPFHDKGSANKLLVMHILESLCDDVINNEDHVAGLRVDALGKALNEIMVPRRLRDELNGERTVNKAYALRSGEDGWLERICAYFASCVKQARIEGQATLNQSMPFVALKALHALRSTMAWINVKGAVEVDIVSVLFLPFHTEDVALQTGAAEVLNAVLCRPYGQHWHDSWLSLMRKTLQPDRISMIRLAFDRTYTAPGENDEKHTLQTKMSEVLSVVADAIAQYPQLAQYSDLDMPAFFDLLLVVLQNKSLVVSIPVLHSWTRLMAQQHQTVAKFVFQGLEVLIQTCSARLLRYESILEESQDEIVQFLLEDFDTIPERHAFLGNYHRYCANVIQAIARSRPLETLPHVLAQMRELLGTGPYTGGRGFDSSKYSKYSLPTLQFDAQYTVVSSALKGFSLWLADVATLPPEDEQHVLVEKYKASATAILQQWSYEMINMHADDPEVAVLILQTLVSILRTLKPEPAFVLHVVQHVLTMRLYDNPAHTTFSEAVKAFEGLRVLELQKLALAFSNELLEVYHELEPRIDVLVAKHSDDTRLVWGYKAFLFMIIHRAPGIHHEVRLARLRQMLKPVYEAWQDPSFSASLANLTVFCDSLGLADLASFYKTYGFDRYSDWSERRLDEAGQARQASIKARVDELPLRMTKSMLAATMERLKSGTEEFDVGCALWRDVFHVILPKLLQMLRHAQAFHNTANWSQLPDELQVVVKRTLQDRFWQSGISNESKDEFYARISDSRSTYEGFASVVRGTMRNVREQGYHLIYLMTKFEEQFYGLPDLAEPLAEALLADADSLSANHLHPIINLATILVQRCPPHYRAQFLPPLLTRLFKKLDAKITGEWDAVTHVTQQTAEDDDLSDEMRMESVLRALTYSAVSFVPLLLDFDADSTVANGGREHVKPLLRNVVLADLSVLEPLILFCTHALRVRDTRCCVAVCKTFRTLVPLFQHNDAPAPRVREFVSDEVLKACITSLNESYFADIQRDLASLIAQILALYAPKTPTPREVLLSLPSLSQGLVDTTLGKICKQPSPGEKHQRALVLGLLDSVKGVSIYEAGKVKVAKEGGKKTVVQRQYMDVEQRPTIVNGNETGLESVAGLFGEG